MIDVIKTAPWVPVVLLLSLAVPMVLLVMTVAVLTIASLFVDAKRREHVVTMLDRLVALAAVVRLRTKS